MRSTASWVGEGPRASTSSAEVLSGHGLAADRVPTASRSWPAFERAVLDLAAGAVTAVFQVLAFGGVVGQADRAFISRDGLLFSSEPVQQVRTGGFGRLEAAGGGHGVRPDRGGGGEA